MWWGLPKATVLFLALAAGFLLCIATLKSIGYAPFLRAHAGQIAFYFLALSGLVIVWDEARFGP